jgi:hypothetical protein
MDTAGTRKLKRGGSRLFRGVAYTLFACALASFLSSSSCSYYDDDHHCHDDDHNCHHHHREATPVSGDPHELTEVLRADGFDPATGSLWTAFEVQGTSVLDATEAGSVSSNRLEAFSTRVLLRNRELLGLPAGGVLVLQGIEDPGATLRVAYALESATGVVTHRLALLYDRLGRLRRIERATVETTDPLGLR